MPGAQVPAQHRKILPRRGMVEKLLNERIPIPLSFRKEQNPGGEAIDSMYDERSLPFLLESCGKQRQCRFSSQPFDRHSGQSSRLIQNHQGVVFVKHG